MTDSARGSNRLVILAGPSCAGKSPLARALALFHKELADKLQPLVLYNSREPRPGERDGLDYRFRAREEIASLETDDGFVVMDVRGDLQALDLRQLEGDLANGDVFFEGNPFVAEVLKTHPSLAGVERLSVFVSPLSREELRYLRSQASVSLPGFVTDVMRRKLLRRTRRQKGELSLEDLENIETRASSAYEELKMAHRFAFVIANHDGEDSENWDAFYYPVGDARRALNAFAALLAGESTDCVETWDGELLP